MAISMGNAHHSAENNESMFPGQIKHHLAARICLVKQIKTIYNGETFITP